MDTTTAKTDAAAATTSAPATTGTFKRPPPQKQTKPAKVSADSPAVAAPTSPAAPSTSRKRQPGSSSDENLDAPVIKKGRASGTLLKDLLQQGSKILQLAASKADEFAPAVVSSTEALERIEHLEKKMKKHNESNKEALEDIKAEIVKLSPTLNAILDKSEGNAKASDLMTNHCAIGLRLDEMLASIREIKEKVEPLDANKIASEMNQLNIRMAELENHYRNAPPASTLQAPTQPPLQESNSRQADDSTRHHTPMPTELHRSPPPRYSRRTPPPRDLRRIPSPRDVRRTPPPRYAHIPSPRDVHRTLQLRDFRRTPPPRDFRRTPPPRDSRRTPPPRDARRTPPPRGSRHSSSPHDGSRRSHRDPID